MRYSIFQLARNALSYNRNWARAWRSPTPKSRYDVVIVGGGGHGLATAYYLAKEHKIGSVAVLEKGWLGGGNTGRNTTIIRSGYQCDASAHLYEHALKLWEGLTAELNFNMMFSQRGVMQLSHSVHDWQEKQRRSAACQLNGIDAHLIDAQRVKELVPLINLNSHYPINGGLWQPRAGIARHDAVAWGYARGADRLGVDIIQDCEVTGFDVEDGAVKGVETTRGKIGAAKVGCVASGHSGLLANMAGFRLPLETYPLQAMVSEPIEPTLDVVVMSLALHGYVSQSDKGELVVGAGTDTHLTYRQRGSFCHIEDTAAAIVELFPAFSRLRMLRQWAGLVDVTTDRSPILSATPVKGLFFNCGWGTGGFKATPGSGHAFAETLARGEASALAAPFSIERFNTGAIVDEGSAAGVAH